MLENLHIKNVALIDEIDISFAGGLNILSGETGTGKSIIIGSIVFVLGGRAGKDFIRNGETLAFVEAVFYVDSPTVLNFLTEAGFDTNGDNSFLIYRSLNQSGKSVCRINGKLATVGMLKEFALYFADLHGQHDSQSLLDPLKHIQLVDKYCGTALDTLKQKLTILYKDFKEISRQIRSICLDENDREATIEMLSFQINEIASAKLKDGEDDWLLKRKALINSSEKLVSAVGSALQLLRGMDTDESSAMDKISRAISSAQEIFRLDESKNRISETLESVMADLESVTEELNDYYESFEHDPSEIDRIESRLDVIYGLKRKYGSTIAEILDFYKKINTRLKFINDSEERLNELKARKKSIELEVVSACREMSAYRKKTAKSIEAEIIASLHELGMKDARFEVRFERKEAFTLNGFDKIEFYLSPNKGESLKPLAKTASGGEMSRIMLALKCVLFDADSVETFVFDEIDAGISGRAAQKVAEKLAFLSKNRQILCITHLPQIAAMADNHYLIEKNIIDGRTLTNVSKLDNEKIVYEIARLTSGAQVTDSTLKASAEMKQLAVNIKNNL